MTKEELHKLNRNRESSVELNNAIQDLSDTTKYDCTRLKIEYSDMRIILEDKDSIQEILQLIKTYCENKKEKVDKIFENITITEKQS